MCKLSVNKLCFQFDFNTFLSMPGSLVDDPARFAAMGECKPALGLSDMRKIATKRGTVVLSYSPCVASTPCKLACCSPTLYKN